MNVQEKNAAYRNAYAEMAARLGDSDAQRLQQSNQYGWEAYNRANGAKTKGIETHLSNLGLISQKWLSQRIKNKQYGDILDIYQQDVDNKKEALKQYTVQEQMVIKVQLVILVVQTIQKEVVQIIRT